MLFYYSDYFSQPHSSLFFFCFRVNFPFGWFYFVLALCLSVFSSNYMSWILDGESALRDTKLLSLWPVGIDSFDLPFPCMTVVQLLIHHHMMSLFCLIWTSPLWFCMWKIIRSVCVSEVEHLLVHFSEVFISFCQLSVQQNQPSVI